MAQRLTSELVVKLTEQVSGPAATARKALREVEQTLNAIGKQRTAQTAVADLSAAYEKARAKVRDLQNQLIATERPSAKLKASFSAAVTAAEGLQRRLAAQKGAVEKGAKDLAALGVAANGLAAAEARLRTEATAAASALAREGEAAARAARQRRSLSRELVRAAHDEAAANRALAASARAANEQKANSAAELALRRRISLTREMTRAANEEAKANRAAAEQARRADEAARRRRDEQRGALGRTASQAGDLASPFILGGAVRSVKRGAELEHEAARSRAAGLTEAEIRENAELAADLTRRYPTIGLASGMHALRNFRSVVGSAEEAGHIADPLFKMRYVVEAAHPGRILEDDFDKLIKGLEIKGVTQDMDRFRDYIQGMTQALNTFGDTLKASDYYEMFKYGRQATQTLERDYMLQVAPTLAQELGGQGAGNAHASFHAGFIGGRMKASAIQQLEEMGLVGDPSKIIRHPQNHRILGAQAGFLKESALAARNPYEWVQTVLLPALKAKVGDDPEKIQEVISGLASNRVAGQFLAILATQQSRIEKDKRLVKNAPGLESYEVYQKDPLVAWKGMTAQLDNLLAVASRPAVTQAAGALQAIAGGLASLAEVSKEHPLASSAAVGAAGVGGLLGTYKLLSGLTGGFGLKASAVALDASAVALTEAAGALAARSVLPGGAGLPAGSAPAAAAGGWWGARLAAKYPFLGRVGRAVRWGASRLGPAALGWTVDEAIVAAGRAAGYGRTDEAIDETRARLRSQGKDWSPRLQERMDDEYLSGAGPSRLKKMDDHEMARRRAAPTGSRPEWRSSGEDAGSSLGTGIADGLGRQSSLVQGVARDLMAAIRAEFAQGITVPVRLDTSSVQSAGGAAKEIAAMRRSIFADTDVG